MKLTVDTDSRMLVCDDNGHKRILNLYSDEAFDYISRLWIMVGWNQKYMYTFSWLGRPVIQLPEDLLRIQEVIYQVKPDVIIETGVAHGGSLVYYASLCKIMNKGRVIGVDVEIRSHNRRALEQHELFDRIDLVEGSSVDPGVVERVNASIHPNESVLVVLDSNHGRAHVRAELEAYHPMVSIGSYLIATDGIMEQLSGVPRGQDHWQWDNPAAAARDFARVHPEFVLEQPNWTFNESTLRHHVTHWPDSWLRRIR